MVRFSFLSLAFFLSHTAFGSTILKGKLIDLGRGEWCVATDVRVIDMESEAVLYNSFADADCEFEVKGVQPNSKLKLYVGSGSFITSYSLVLSTDEDLSDLRLPLVKHLHTIGSKETPGNYYQQAQATRRKALEAMVKEAKKDDPKFDREQSVAVLIEECFRDRPGYLRLDERFSDDKIATKAKDLAKAQFTFSCQE